mgnify:CR=1 FL=1
MYKSNVIVLVTEAERNKLVVWDDHTNKVRSEIAFDAGLQILNIKLSKDIMTVVFENKSFIFDFVTLKFIEKIFEKTLGCCKSDRRRIPAEEYKEFQKNKKK